jgi:hypothetical protein
VLAFSGPYLLVPAAIAIGTLAMRGIRAGGASLQPVLPCATPP